jgi:hypothetical protein
MKSSFLLIALAIFSWTSQVFAQMSLRPNPKDMLPESSFEKFHKRLRISYFGIFTSPHMGDLKYSRFRNAALSPEFTGGSNQDSWPMNMWNQINFAYNFGAKLSFSFIPRWMTPLAHPEFMKGEDRSLIALEDFLVGFGGVIHTSEDKKFNLWIRPGIRLPTSRVSRNSGQDGAGTLSHNLEIAYLPTYDFNKTWQLGIFGQVRQWVIEDHYDFTRFRFYTAPFIQYTLSDVSRLQLYYEHIWETNRRNKPVGDRDPVFKDMWQNVFLGYSRDITPKFNAMPFIGVFVNDKPARINITPSDLGSSDVRINEKSIWFGAWISYTFK